ncbi:MAG: hypothetical protein AAF436_06525 [Myxococcota bacterium]
MRVFVALVLMAAWLGFANGVHAEPTADDLSPQYAAPRATAALQTPQPVWVNQLTELEVVLYRDDAEPNKAPPDFAEVRVPGTIAIRTDYAPPPEVRILDGVAFLLQKRRYLLFPQRVGSIEVPPIEVSWVSRDGSRSRVRAEPVSFQAKLPAGAGSAPYVVATALSLSETIDGDLDRFRVGDSATRTVTVEATGTDGMMLPALDLGAPSHLTDYPTQADLGTTVVRGRYDAHRADATTFVAESFGWTRLPEVRVRWLNPETGRWHTETVPGRSFRVRINPSLGWTAFGSTDSNARRLGVLVLLILLGWLLYLAWRRRDARTLRHAPRGPSERSLFLRVLRESYRGDALGALNAAYRWMGARDRTHATLHAFCERVPEAQHQSATLQRFLFARRTAKSSWSGRAFASAMRKLRRARPHAHDRPDLPPLNPCVRVGVSRKGRESEHAG